MGAAMRGGDIDIDRLSDAIQAALDSLKTRGFEQPMQEAKVMIHRGIRAGYNSSADPATDENWPPRKRRYPHPILIKTGAMMQAATGGGAGAIQQIRARRLTVGVDSSIIGYAYLHQVGSGKLASRPFVGASDETVDAIGELIADAGLAAFLES